MRHQLTLSLTPAALPDIPTPHAVSDDIATDSLYVIARAALRRVLPGERAEFDDLLQTVLERVLRSLRDRTFSHQCSLPTWVSVVAAHVAIDWVRSNSRRRARLELVDNPELSDSHRVRAWVVQDELLEARSLLRYVQDLIATMAPNHGQPLILHDIQGLELREVATTLKISMSAAQSRLVRARYELRQKLAAID